MFVRLLLVMHVTLIFVHIMSCCVLVVIGYVILLLTCYLVLMMLLCSIFTFDCVLTLLHYYMFVVVFAFCAFV